MSGVIPVAAGWVVRQAINDEPPPPGDRAFGYGQNGAFSAAREAESPTTDEHALLVNIVKWLRGGRSYGTVWVSTVQIDVEFNWGFSKGYDSVAEVSQGSVNALTAAGFTVTYSSDTSKQFSAGDYDVLILGDGGGWGSGLTNAQKASQIRDFIAGPPYGGVLLLRNAYVWWEKTVGPYYLNMGTTNVHNIRAERSTCYTGDATNGFGIGECLPAIFTSGMTLQVEAPHYIGIYGGNNDYLNRGEGGVDGDLSCGTPAVDPFRHFVWYSGHGDLNGKKFYGA